MNVAAEELEADASDLETDGKGNIQVKGAPARAMPVFQAALAAHFKHGKTVSGRGMFMVQRSYPVPETGHMRPSTCYAHACTIAEVEVDTETGEVAVLSLKSAYEVGRALNPKMVEQQIVGGALDGDEPRALRDDGALLSRPRARAGRLQRISDAGAGRHAGVRGGDPGAPVRRRAVRRQGRRRDDGELADPGDRQRHLRRGRRARRIRCRSRRRRCSAASRPTRRLPPDFKEKDT